MRESKWVFIVNVSSVEYILRSWRVVKFTCFVVNVETKYHLANRPWTEYKIRFAYGLSPISAAEDSQRIRQVRLEILDAPKCAAELDQHVLLLLESGRSKCLSRRSADRAALARK